MFEQKGPRSDEKSDPEGLEIVDCKIHSYNQVDLQAYGPPSLWNSLDLVELGDLLIVMRTSDLAEVAPTSLRLAASQLANNSQYSTILTEVRTLLSS